MVFIFSASAAAAIKVHHCGARADGGALTSLTCRSPMELRGVVLTESLRAAPAAAAAAAARFRWFLIACAARLMLAEEHCSDYLEMADGLHLAI